MAFFIDVAKLLKRTAPGNLNVFFLAWVNLGRVQTPNFSSAEPNSN